MTVEKKPSWDIICILALLCLVLLFLYDPLITGKTYIEADIESQQYMFRSYMYEMGQAHRLFFWYPHIYCGQPFIADIQSAVFYPLNWIYFFITPERGMVYYVFIHLLLASLLSYFLLRKLDLSPLASLCGAAFYSFSSFMVLKIPNSNILAGWALLPGVLLAAEYFVERRNILHAAILGLCMGMNLLAGYPQTIVIMYMIVFVYIIGHFDFRKLFSPVQLKTVWLLTGAVLFSFMIAAVQLLPSSEFIALTIRSGGMPFELSALRSVGFNELMMFFVPDYMGCPGGKGGNTADPSFWELCYYFGIFPFMLALFAPIQAREGDRRRVMIFVALALLGFAIALGRHFFLYRLMYSIVPFFSSQRVPARYLFMCLPALAYLVALAVERLPAAVDSPEKGKKALRYAFNGVSAFFLLLFFIVIILPPAGKTGVILFLITGAAGLLLLFLAIKGKASGNIIPFSSLFLILLGSFCFNLCIAPPATWDCSYYNERSCLFASRGGKIPPERVYYFPENKMKWTINHSGARGVTNIVGYNPLILENYAEYMLFAEFGVHLTPDVRAEMIHQGNMFKIMNFDNPMISLLNITIYYSLTYDSTQTCIKEHKIKVSYPRAFLVYDHRVICEKLEIMKLLKSGRVDPTKTVILEEDPGFTAEGENNPGGPVPGSNADITAFEPDYIKIAVDPVKKGWLFVSEMYFPGWKACVDGKERKIYRADSLFRAVPLEPGDRVVEFFYRPLSFAYGKALTLAALALFTVVLIISLVQGLQKGKKPDPDAA